MTQRPRPDMQRCTLLAEIIARESLQAAPWVCYMQQLVPFSQSVCVAGSVGTWLAEYDVHSERPSWDPSDIDVFVMLPSRLAYVALCDAFVDSFACPPVDHAPIRISVNRPYPHILIVQWWLTCNDVEFRCPDFSFIHSPTILSVDLLLDQFDIDICKVSVRLCADHLCFCLSSVVRSHIFERVMHCVMRQDPSSAAFYYPMQKTLDRVCKYAVRGYKFQSLQFWPSHSYLNVAAFEHVWLPQHLQASFLLDQPPVSEQNRM